MIKYSVTFSSNHNGLEKSEEYVKSLTIQSLMHMGIDGATLVKNIAGMWQGQSEDSYTIYILSDDGITAKVEGLALNLKQSLEQFSVLIEKTLTDIKFL